jgi:hypothetical protein
MSKRTIYIRIIGTFAFLILFFPAATYADQYYDQYPGNGFVPRYSSSVYFRSPIYAHINHSNTEDEHYMCPVNFNVADGSTYFIKSIGMRYKDNLTDGYIIVTLKRKNLYTGNDHIVASWGSGLPDASTGDQTASQGTNAGVKLVDTKKFVYWLYVYFYRDGSANPSANLKLYQVRIHYGT